MPQHNARLSKWSKTKRQCSLKFRLIAPLTAQATFTTWIHSLLVFSLQPVSFYVNIYSCTATKLSSLVRWQRPYTYKCILSVEQNVNTHTFCSEKWLAPRATAAVGPQLPSKRRLILMQVNPTLTSSSPPWPIISPPLPLSPPHALCSYSHFLPHLSPITHNLFLTLLPLSLIFIPYLSLCLSLSLSLSLFLSSTFDPTLLSLFLSPPQSCLKEISKPIRQQF